MDKSSRMPLLCLVIIAILVYFIWDELANNKLSDSGINKGITLMANDTEESKISKNNEPSFGYMTPAPDQNNSDSTGTNSRKSDSSESDDKLLGSIPINKEPTPEKPRQGPNVVSTLSDLSYTCTIPKGFLNLVPALEPEGINKISASNPLAVNLIILLEENDYGALDREEPTKVYNMIQGDKNDILNILNTVKDNLVLAGKEFPFTDSGIYIYLHEIYILNGLSNDDKKTIEDFVDEQCSEISSSYKPEWRD